jgi:hypothetical protein
MQIAESVQFAEEDDAIVWNSLPLVNTQYNSSMLL